MQRHAFALATLANSRQANLAKSSQDEFSRVGYSSDMAENQNLIREIRKRRGLTLEQLGALTMNPRTGKPTDLATIQKIETGKRKLDGDWRTAIAEALGVEPDELVGATVPRRPVRRVPLLGKIAAGNWRAAMEDPLDLIPTTKGGANTFALEPDGDSMNNLIPHGGIIFCDPDDKALVANSYYAMMRPGGEMTFKQYLDNPPRLAPCSSNPEHKEMLLGEEPLTVIGRIIGYNADL
ncbi:helix-turn-helix domain-containing protein [Sphingobium sp. S8]|uniref:helix-turn-helix domain-containing protein n=1 Tax=Sphingobium sp. S8 TaxID=2758385 RepID=UPI00191AF1DA|nr:LexA family transcriptional regulator [Sphingobium sp. S8]